MRKDKNANKEYAKQYYIKNKEKIKLRNDEWYRNNKDTAELKEKRRLYREEYENNNRERLKLKAIMYYRKIKDEVFSHYGKICNVCKIEDIEFLEIDHIYGNGRKHLRSLKKDGIGFYLWLRKNNYPEDYQTLCSNCNWNKRLQSIEFKQTKASISSIKTRKNNKKLLFERLGMYCICCGIDNLELLTVEHKHNDGCEELRKYGRYKMLKMIASGALDTNRYETLCRNCNFSKGRNGYCPHFPTLKELIQ